MILEELSIDSAGKNKIDLMANKNLRKMFNCIGVDKDDILQEIKLSIWQGVRYYDSSHSTAPEVYFWKIIKNKMNSMRKYYATRITTMNRDFQDFPLCYEDKGFISIIFDSIIGSLKGRTWYVVNLMLLGFSKKHIMISLKITPEMLSWEMNKLKYIFQS